ncbi:MAG: 3'-5' exonuclease [Gemmatimonadales bacterium]
MTYGGIQTRPEATLLTDRAAIYLRSGPADVVDLIGHVCNLPAAPRIVAEHMAHAMFSGRPEFVKDSLGRWTLIELPTIPDRGAGEIPNDRRHTGHTEQRGPRRRGKRVIADLPPQPLASVSWAVVDVETTGGVWPSDRITEIAVVIVRDGEVKTEERFETLVNPLRPIPPFVSRMTRITWDMVKHAPTFSAIAPRLVDALQGSVFVAHNVAFDWKFVSNEVTRASGIRLAGSRLCTVRLARSLLPHLPRRSLDHVAYHYGVEISGRHRAGGDALATARCLVALLKDAAQRGCTTWEDLDILLGHRAARKRRRREAWPSPVTKDTTA